MQTAPVEMPSDLKVTDLVTMANSINCELVSKGGKLQMIPRATNQCAGLLAVKSETFNHPTAGEKYYARAMVTHKGINWLLNKLEKKHGQKETNHH